VAPAAVVCEPAFIVNVISYIGAQFPFQPIPCSFAGELAALAVFRSIAIVPGPEHPTRDHLRQRNTPGRTRGKTLQIRRHSRRHAACNSSIRAHRPAVVDAAEVNRPPFEKENRYEET